MKQLIRFVQALCLFNQIIFGSLALIIGLIFVLTLAVVLFIAVRSNLSTLNEVDPHFWWFIPCALFVWIFHFRIFSSARKIIGDLGVPEKREIVRNQMKRVGRDLLIVAIPAAALSIFVSHLHEATPLSPDVQAWQEKLKAFEPVIEFLMQCKVYFSGMTALYSGALVLVLERLMGENEELKSELDAVV